ncbi:uncharacterized protein LOC144664048 isoform X1 [Oculina patagonica]
MIAIDYILATLLLMALLNQAYGMGFVTEQNKKTMALTGSNQTFAWKLSFTDQEKSRQIKVHFGPWDKQHDVIDAIRITYVREASGKETIKSTVKKFYWTGDLTLDYVAFTLFNAQRHDSGDYGIRIRVDEDHVPETEMSWFTLSVQDPPTLPPKAPGVCKSAMGMKSKGIPNANISASSTLSTNHVPAFARLDERQGAWCSAPNDNSPYVEILLDEEKLITKVVTQGSYKDLLWATKYQIKYLKEGKWSSYQKADGSLKLEGNTNVRALKKHDLQPPIRTNSIRIYPMAPLSVMPNEYNVICLRLELFGCSVISCGDPGTPINGEQARVKIGYIYSGSVEFTCKDNYTLSGASEIYCEETKYWSSPLPQCWAPCPDPRVPSNGRRIGDDFRHGKSVTFKCQDEFELKGMATINCNDGKWTDDIPQCKASCPDPGVPSNGRRTGDDFRHGKSVTFKCQDEFELKGMATINCNDGTWTDDIPQCKARKSCAEHYINGERISGVFTINPEGAGAMAVYCDLTTPGGGWTVIQKRFDGSVYFYRGWDDYKTGFGDLNGEFWLGLDKIHRLTKYRRYMLRVDLEDTSGNKAYAQYDIFAVSSERTKYQLSLGSYSGTAGDSLSYHRGHPFTTKDRDNDISSGNCAVSYKGAWWYAACHRSNLNGKYHHGAHSSFADGVNWYAWKGYYNSVKKSEMKIRPA